MEEEMSENSPRLTKSEKILSFFIGDIRKWRKLPSAFRELKNDFKNPKKAFNLAFIGVLSLSLTLFFMYGVYLFQNNAQYCQVINKPVYGSDLQYAGDLPINNMSLAYYTNLYKGSRIPINVVIQCNFDLNRFIKERF